jgi:SulP family sulfate permease
VRLVVCGLTHQPREIARRSGWLAMIPEADLQPDLASALASIDPDNTGH